MPSQEQLTERVKSYIGALVLQIVTQSLQVEELQAIVAVQNEAITKLTPHEPKP